MLLEYHDYQCWSWGDAAPFCTTSYVHLSIMTPVGHPNSSNHPDVLAQTVRSIRDITNTVNINVQQREWLRSTVVNSRWNEMQAVTVWLRFFISSLKLRLGSSLTEVKQRAKDENKSHNKYTTILLFCIEFILYSTVGRVWVPPPPLQRNS